MQDIVLFTIIEPDMNDINTNSSKVVRYFEQEAIKCFSHWRNNAGWLKDVEIYTMCPTKADISQETKDKFEELNVNYIHEHLPETDSFTCGFWNIPLVGKYFENKFPNKTLLKIDLDMYILKELPKEWFDEDCSIAVHDELAHNYFTELGQRDPVFKNFYNTGFTITKPGLNFFHEQYDVLEDMEKSFHNNTILEDYNIDVRDDFDQDEFLELWLLEEACVSIMESRGLEINKLRNFYLEVYDNEFETNENMKPENIYFIHEHIEKNVDYSKTKIEYMKQLKIDGYRYYFTYKDNL